MTEKLPLGLKKGVSTTELHFSPTSWVDVYSECHLSQLIYGRDSEALKIKLIKFYNVGPLENGTEITINFLDTKIQSLEMSGATQDTSTISGFTVEAQDKSNGQLQVRIEFDDFNILVACSNISVDRQAAETKQLLHIVEEYISKTGEKKFPGSNIIESR